MGKRIDTDNLNLSGAASSGVFVNGGRGWMDIIGLIIPDPLGANAPTIAAYKGGARGYAYSGTDKIDCFYHIPHNYAKGTDMFLHAHWGHNGTAISGSFIINCDISYADRDGNFIANITPQISATSLSIGNTPQYKKTVTEIPLTTAGGSASTIDTGLITVDGGFLITFTVSTIPLITGGSPNEPFIFTLDVHCQSTEGGTALKDAPFYV